MRAAAIRENGGRHVSASPPKPLSEGEGSEMMVKQSIEHIEEYTASHSLTPNPSPKERGVKCWLNNPLSI